MSQKIYTNLDIKGNTKIGDIANATSDTDKFLVSDAGVVKYRTGSEMLSDLGVAPGVASNVQHQVKAGVAINKGQAVYVTSADGTNMIVGLASNATEVTSSKTMGLLDNTVAINGFANVVTEGLLAGLNTIGANAGDPVWLGTNGNLIYGIANKPYAPAHLVFIGIVTRVNANNGEIFVKVQNGFELDELHDVDLKSSTPVGNQILAFEGAPVNLWKNKTISSVLGYTPYNASNPAGYISSYSETDTLASVTGRGASTSTNVSFNGGASISTLSINGAPAWTEGTLAIGAQGVDEGGQFVLNKATSWTYAAHFDVWRDTLRFLYGTNTATSGSIMSLNLSTRQMILHSYTAQNSFPGTAAAYLGVDSSGNVITVAGSSGGVTSVGGTGGYGGLTLSGTVTSSGNLTLGGTPTGTWPISVSGNADTVDNLHASDFVRAYSTSNDNIDSDWGQSFKTFDPIPSGTPPIASPNLRTINIGENYSRRTQLSFDYAANRAWFRRRQDSTWSAWSEFIHSDNISSFAVPSARTITINGTSYDLSANRSWTIATSETDTLATVTGRGATTTTSLTANSFIKTGGNGAQFLMADGTTSTNPGWLISINSLLVTNALGYTPYNSSNPNGYITSSGSISGTAGSETLATVTARGNTTSTGVGFNNYVDILNQNSVYWYNSGNTIAARTYFDGGTFNLDKSLWVTANIYGDVFYDRNNSAYYGDFASTSRINTINIDTLRGPQGDWLLGYQSTSTYSLGSTAVVDTLNIDFSTVKFSPGSGNLGNNYFWLNKGGSNDGGLLWSRDNALDWQMINATGSGDLTFYAYGSGTNVLTLGRSGGAVTATGSMRSPIFYDANDTGYYIDPASTSKLSNLQVLGTIADGGGNGIIRLYGNLHIDSYNGNDIYMNYYSARGTRIYVGSGTLGLHVSTDGQAYAGNSFRAPIFYDSNNTGYYVDPSNTSNINTAIVNGLLSVSGSTGNYNEGIRLMSGTGSWSNIQFGANTSGVGTQANQWIVGKMPSGNFVMSVAGNQDSGSRLLIDQGGSTQAPIYYDGNDTSYYINPNGTARLSYVVANGGIRIDGNENLYLDNNYGQSIVGLYTSTRYQGVFAMGNSYKLPIDGSSPGSLYGLAWSHPNAGGVAGNLNTHGLLAMENGTWLASLTGSTRARDDMRAPIFYDNNNTGYYVDPASTSVVNVMQPYYLRRNTHSTGHLEGSYNNVGSNDAKSNPIYTIGSSYNPSDTSLSNMYGVGYAHPNFWGGGKTNSWGMYVAEGGTFVATIGVGIWTSGDVTAYSDIRVKDNIEVIENALDKIKAIRGVTFTRKDASEEDKDKRHAGVIAQEVMKVLPEVVTGTEESKYSVAYGNMAGLFIEAIKEQQKQIEELKELVNQLIKK